MSILLALKGKSRPDLQLIGVAMSLGLFLMAIESAHAEMAVFYLGIGIVHASRIAPGIFAPLFSGRLANA